VSTQTIAQTRTRRRRIATQRTAAYRSDVTLRGLGAV
jgi:hypothetical protein